jgi:hypothetical protein
MKLFTNCLKFRALIYTISMLFMSGSQTKADLAFIGFSADNSDDFAIVTLRNYSASTVFRFTDNEWNGTAFNTGEGFFSWTSSSDISAGTILRFNNVSVVASRTVTDGMGSAVGGAFLGGSMAISNSDEGIYSYFGTSDTAVTTQLASIRIDDNTNSGSAFSSGANILLNSPADGDIWVYSGAQSIVADSFSDFVPLLTNANNWTLQGDGSGDQTYTAPSGRFEITAVPEPSSVVLFSLIGLGGIAVRRFRKGRAG